MHVFDWFYQLPFLVLYPLTLFVTVGAAEVGIYLGGRRRNETEFGTPTGSALGLLALLLAFSVSLAVGRFDARRNNVLEEAIAISSAADHALAIPQPHQSNVLALLRDYVTVRIGLGVPYDPVKFDRDVARSQELRAKLWNEAMQVVAIRDSPSTNRFVNALSQVSIIHERRVSALRFHVPGMVTAVLVLIAMVALGFSGYHAGTTTGGRHIVVVLMAVMVTIVMMLVIDLDRPVRGMITVSVQPLIDTQQTMPSS
jgi:hypothetical protein